MLVHMVLILRVEHKPLTTQMTCVLAFNSMVCSMVNQATLSGKALITLITLEQFPLDVSKHMLDEMRPDFVTLSALLAAVIQIVRMCLHVF